MHSEISGLVVECVFQNPDNQYGVIKLEPDGQGRLITACGSLAHLVPGEHIVARGVWKDHQRFGKQFFVDSFSYELPNTKSAVVRFLGSGLIEGVGPNLAQRIVDHFGEKTIDVLDHAPGRLKEVKGCGPKKRAAIQKFCKERKDSKEFLLFLNQQGIGLAQGMKILKVYGDRALSVLQEQPYSMVNDVPQFGFQTVDRLAMRMGVPSDHPNRLEEGVLYVMKTELHDGHGYVKKDGLEHRVQEVLAAPHEHILNTIDRLIQNRRLTWVSEWVCLPQIYHMESQIAQTVGQKVRYLHERHVDQRLLSKVLERSKIELAPSQSEAVLMALKNSVLCDHRWARSR